MVSRTHERQEFIVAVVKMAQEKPLLTEDGAVVGIDAIGIARSAMRLATSEQKWCEIECSVNVDDAECAKQERKSERRRETMREIALWLGVELEVSGDPRGAVYRLGGVAVPADGYTAEQIERVSRYWDAKCAREESKAWKEATKP